MSLKDKISKFYPLIIILFGLLICVLMIIFRPEVKPDEVKFPDPFVQIKKISPSSINIIIKSQGSIIPQKESQIFPEIIGPVVYVSSKLYEGSSFNKGDILARIDSKDYELDIKSAESTLAAAKTKLSFEEAESNSAREEWEKIGSGKPGDLTLRIPQLNQAKSAVEAAQANLERLKRNLDKTIIKAPYDGLVRKKNIDIGTVVSPGYLLASVYATDYVEVKLPIPDEDLAFLEIPLDGTEIDIQNQSQVNLMGSFGGEKIIWNGRIVRMEAEIDPKSRMAILIARVSNPYDLSKYKIPLRVGQFVEAEIIGKKFNNLYTLNRELIKNTNQVVIVNELDSTLEFKSVNIIRYVDDNALINKGLNNKVPICITNLDVMYNGMKVQLK
tara:strand:+ start:11360 stop:12517 length:1158 start_codon:yes stop_codon:yes gene_type:complete